MRLNPKRIPRIRGISIILMLLGKVNLTHPQEAFLRNKGYIRIVCTVQIPPGNPTPFYIISPFGNNCPSSNTSRRFVSHFFAICEVIPYFCI